MSEVVPFVFDFEGNPVHTVTRDGEPWFVLAEVCRVLTIGNPSDAAARLDDDEKDTLDSIEGGKINGLGTVGAMPIVISESGLYSLILSSRKAAAKRFKRWVTGEVLPAIRKNGSYGVSAADPIAALNDPETLRRLLLTNVEQVIALKADNAKLAPKANALDRIATASGSLNITETAKALQIRPGKLFDFLRCNGWIYRRNGGKGWLGYQNRVNPGDLEHKVAVLQRPDGTDKITEQVLVTPRGLAKLADLLSPSEENGELPL